MAQCISGLLIYKMEEYELCTPVGTPLGTPLGTQQPQVSQRTPSQGQRCTTPSAYEDYQQQWATVVEDDRRDGERLVDCGWQGEG